MILFMLIGVSLTCSNTCNNVVTPLSPHEPNCLTASASGSEIFLMRRKYKNNKFTVCWRRKKEIPDSKYFGAHKLSIVMSQYQCIQLRFLIWFLLLVLLVQNIQFKPYILYENIIV